MGVDLTHTWKRAIALAVVSSLVGALVAVPAVMAVGASPSTTTLGNPSLDPKPVGQSASIAAIVTDGATGSVEFYLDDVHADTVALTGTSASYTIPADLAAGPHAIRAEYPGDDTFAPSESAVVDLQVGPRPVVVTIDGVSGPHDPTGAFAQKGDVISVSVTVADDGTHGSLDVAGAVKVKVDGVLKATIALPQTTADLDTAGWPLGTRSIVATFEPTGTDHATASSPAFPLSLVANVVEAVALAPSPGTFYPYKDSYRDTVAIRGRRDETASVSIKIYSSTGKLVRTLAVASGTGAWSASWNGRNTGGSLVGAGKYKVRQTVRDALGASRTLPSQYVNVSAKRLYTKTVTLKQSTAQHDAGSLSKGWLGWKFTLPAATVYKKVAFGVYGKSGIPQGVFGPHHYGACPSTTRWDWYDCLAPYQLFPTSLSWRNVVGSPTTNRHGRTVRMYAVGGNRTQVSHARVTVTYGVLR